MLEVDRTVLVVDDDPQMRELIMVILELAGYESTEAHDGAAALASLEVNPLPDVVVTDLMMPGMSGMELIRRIRAEALTATLPVLVVSANADAPEAAEIAALATAMIGKDSVVQELAEAVRRVISPAVIPELAPFSTAPVTTPAPQGAP
jgi:CheY-like chemotaxis protein